MSDVWEAYKEKENKRWINKEMKAELIIAGLTLAGMLLMVFGGLIMHFAWFGYEATVADIIGFVLNVEQVIKSIQINPVQLVKVAFRGVLLVVGFVIAAVGWVLTMALTADSMERGM